MKGSAIAIKPHIDVEMTTFKINGGIYVDIFETFAKKYGIRYYLKSATDYITFKEDGSLGGAMGDVSTFVKFCGIFKKKV